MNGAVMAFAMYEARKAVKRELYNKGIKLHQVEACEISRRANQHIDDHPEIIAFAAERYQHLVERGHLKPTRTRRKPSQ